MNTKRINSAALFALVCFNCADAQNVVIDGSFDDWEATHSVMVDPADAPRGSYVDFLRLSAQSDGEFVHLIVDFGKPVNIQRLPGSIYIILDVDGDIKTGREIYDLVGADLAVVLSPPGAKDPRQTSGGIGVESATWEPPAQGGNTPSWVISPYNIGFTFGPTYQSQIVEMRIQRGAEIPQTPALFTGKRYGIALVAMDPLRNVLDQTKPAYADLPEHTPPSNTLAISRDATNGDNTALLHKHPNTDFRAVNWNVEFSAIMQQPQNFMPVLKALDADILFFQELDERTNADQLAQLLNQHLNANNNDPWTVFIGHGGGNLRCAVASRLPTQTIPGIEPLPYPDDPKKTTRHAAALIRQGDHKLLATSIHLRCCGSADSYEEEVRMMETGVLNLALRKALSSTRSRGVLVAGDFNLVGAREPIERMRVSLDVDHSELEIASPFQLDGRSNATWADSDQPYVPGRLDYVLFSDSSLEVVRSFVFDAHDLPESLGKQLGIDSEMTARASDHLPVVVDCRWK